MKGHDIADPVAEWRRIRAEYTLKQDMMSQDDTTMALLSAVSGLPLPEKTLMLMYADIRSYRKMGRMLGLSHMTVRREIMRIRRMIMERTGRKGHGIS